MSDRPKSNDIDFNWSEAVSRVADSQRQAGNALRADAYRDSVGLILTKDGKKPDGTDATTGGTGFFVDKTGLLATDYHVIQDAKGGAITVRTSDGQTHKARVVGVDTGHDLALLQVEPTKPNQTYIPIDLAASSADLKPTDQMLTRGHPHRSDQSVLSAGSANTKRPLSSFDLEGGLLPGESANRTLIVTKMSGNQIEHGDSGSPLIRQSDGKVFGIVDFNADKTGSAISTPVEDLNNLIARTRRELASGQSSVPAQFRVAEISGVQPRPYSSPSTLTEMYGRKPAEPVGRIPTPINPGSTISIFSNIETLPRR